MASRQSLSLPSSTQPFLRAGCDFLFAVCVMYHVDLFSGIGGMTLALEGVSEPMLYCDKCPHARAVISSNIEKGKLPDAPILHDVNDVCEFMKDNKTKAPDCVVAGFPCTGFSVAGCRTAFNNEGSSLFFKLIDVCCFAKPTFVFMENTPWIAEKTNMYVLESAFARIGYTVTSCILPAYSVGLPHNRFRWYAVAMRDGFEPPKAVFALEIPKLSTWKGPCRTTMSPQVCPTARFMLLKNALVPACARLALVHLLCKRPIPGYEKPNLNLMISQGELVIKKTLWPTLFGHYRKGSKILTQRTSGDLITALIYEKDTEPGIVNFEFLEWLMGFSPGWTLF